MNLLEYVQSLGSDISLEEKIFLTKNWKKKNEPTQEVAQEEKPNKFNEDGSLNVDSFSEETRGAAEKVNEKKKTAAAQDNATAPPVVSEKFNFGVGKSLFQESEWLKAYKKDEKQKKAYDDQQAKFNSVVSKEETYTANAYDFKWNVGKGGTIEYYQKKEGTNDWKKETNNLSIFSIAGELGHLDKEQEAKLKAYKKQQQKQKKSAFDFNAILERNKKLGNTEELEANLNPKFSLGSTSKPETLELTGDINKELISKMDNDLLTSKSSELTYYTIQKNKVKEIQLQRSELKNKATRFAKSEGLNEQQTLDLIDKELENFDEQYGSDIELIEELNGLTPLQRDALQQLKKDTGNNASIGNVSQQFGNYLNSGLKVLGVDLESV
jgi:hypothetical protein